MTLAMLPALLVVLLCAGLFVLLFQYLFPRPAPWKMAAAAIAISIVATLLLGLILHRFMGSGMESTDSFSSLSSALPFVILYVGLPEEATKALSTMIVLLVFRRTATPAQAFQAALFAAIGFAIVENRGYAEALSEVGLFVAFGRGFVATLTHTLLAMIFGAFLMRFVAGGWRAWHLPAIGFLAAAGCHALYDWGLLPLLSEFLRTGSMTPETVLGAAPIVVVGIALVVIAGLRSLRGAIRRAADGDPITAEAGHQAVVARWRRVSTFVLWLGLLGLPAAIGWAILAETAPAGGPPDLQQAMLLGGAFMGSLFAIVLGWVLRQKR